MEAVKSNKEQNSVSEDCLNVLLNILAIFPSAKENTTWQFKITIISETKLGFFLNANS